MIALTAVTTNEDAQLQLDQLASLFTWGSVAADGSINQGGTGDWYPIRNSAGNYTVVFRLPHQPAPVVMVAPTADRTFHVTSTGASFTAVFGADVLFMFVVVG